jgi:hypothetical protein
MKVKIRAMRFDLMRVGIALVERDGRRRYAKAVWYIEHSNMDPVEFTLVLVRDGEEIPAGYCYVGSDRDVSGQAWHVFCS